MSALFLLLSGWMAALLAKYPVLAGALFMCVVWPLASALLLMLASWLGLHEASPDYPKLAWVLKALKSVGLDLPALIRLLASALPGQKKEE